MYLKKLCKMCKACKILIFITCQIFKFTSYLNQNKWKKKFYFVKNTIYYIFYRFLQLLNNFLTTAFKIETVKKIQLKFWKVNVILLLLYYYY